MMVAHLVRTEDKNYTFKELQDIAEAMFQHGTMPPQFRTPQTLEKLAAHYQYLNSNFWSAKDYILFKVKYLLVVGQ